MVVRWYCGLPLSAAQVARLLAERHIDGSTRTVLHWVQTFGPQRGVWIGRVPRPLPKPWRLAVMAASRSKTANVICWWICQGSCLARIIHEQKEDERKLYSTGRHRVMNMTNSEEERKKGENYKRRQTHRGV